jgi:Divergent InlB B-repeat domain
VSPRGDGKGRVTSEPTGIDCGADCAMTVSLDATARLSAEAGEGSTFAGWTVAGCSGVGPCDVTLDTDRGVVVEFDANETPPEDARSRCGMKALAQAR